MIAPAALGVSNCNKVITYSAEYSMCTIALSRRKRMQQNSATLVKARTTNFKAIVLAHKVNGDFLWVNNNDNQNMNHRFLWLKCD